MWRSMSIFYSVLVLCISLRVVWSSNFVSQLREDRNLDLSADEEYEDLRAELLAYHTAFASLAAADRTDAIGPDENEQPQGRRSLGSTPCWKLGGICIRGDLCPKGNKYLTEVEGCRDKLRVCCFTWNQVKLKDMTSFGINNWAFPWSIHYEFGGEGFNMDQGGKDETDDDSENAPKRPGGEDEENEDIDENEPSDIIKQPISDDDDENDEKPEERKRRRLRKGGHKKPLAFIVKT